MIIKKDMNFTPKNKNRRLHIYLPDDYEASSDRYPVMYFFDGHNLFYNEDATYGKSWGLKEYLDQWQKKIILVGIECGHEGDERLAEYCPYHMWAHYCGDLHGTGDVTMNWIVHEVKPLIDATFRTLPERETTGIGGSSMGGLMALYAGIVYNETFSKAACLSSSIAPCMKQIKQDLDAHTIHEDTRFYLSWGEEEARYGNHASEAMSLPASKNNVTMASWLIGQGAEALLYMQPKGHHCEADWEKQNHIYMPFLWQ